MKTYALLKLFMAFGYLFRDVNQGRSIGTIAIALIFVFFALRRFMPRKTSRRGRRSSRY